MEISQIKAQLTLSQVLKYYGLKADKQNRINCPFHPDKTPSMQLYWKTHTAYCFSANCTTHGKSMDVIDFVMMMEKTDKHNALLKCMEILNQQQPMKNSLNNEPLKQTTLIQLSRTEVLQNMFTYFKNAVHNSKPARDYISLRGLDPTKLEIGYNTAQFHHGARRDETLINNCISVGLLTPWGVNNRRPEETAYKPFAKYCICFALKNKVDQVTGLYFRSTVNNEESKHYYLKESTGLYPNYPNPETQILIIAESIIDAASLLQIESINKNYTLLASYGTNRLNTEIKIAIKDLHNLTEIIFAFDNDKAGNKAVEKYRDELIMFNDKLLMSKLVLPEGEDVNSTLVAHNEDIFSHLLEERQMLNQAETFSFSNEKSNEKKKIQPIEQEQITDEQEETPQNLQSPVLQSAICQSVNLPINKKLNTTDKDQIHYNTKELLITLLGGVNLMNLDRLVVTTYMRRNPHINAQMSIRQRVDLYQDDQIEKFIRRAAEKIQISTTHISQAMAELTEDVENWRIQETEHQKKQSKKRKEISQTEREQAVKDLKQDELMEFTQDGLSKTGIVGEEINSTIMYLIMTSRKRERPLHIISLGSSGSGKTHLQEQVSQCIPEEDKLEITIMSDNAFYYFTKEELKHVVILLEDLQGAQTVLYPLRELQSKQKLSKTVTLKDKKGNLRTVQLDVEGPVCVAGCTTAEKIYEDNASRSFLIYIDESKEQEEKVMEYQRKESAGLINHKLQQDIKERFKNMQRVLKPIKVRNPYAMELRIPEKIFKPRRTNAHYLQFIETITFYHQYQREHKQDKETGEKYIETTIEDIKWANKLIAEVLLRKADELSGVCRNFFETLKSHLQGNKKETFYAKEIRQALGLSIDKVKKYLIELTKNSYIKIVGGNKYKTGFEYQVADLEEYNKLKKSVDKVLNDLLENIISNQNTKSKTENRAHCTTQPRDYQNVNGSGAVVQM